MYLLIIFLTTELHGVSTTDTGWHGVHCEYICDNIHSVSYSVITLCNSVVKYDFYLLKPAYSFFCFILLCKLLIYPVICFLHTFPERY